ncbi:protein-tyrosine-phosphatase [Arachidicoccus ginsenosidimutans]|uniref:low molecular weight protein-tyrosine-phosphatase n=1 Tax=Arachidicoccus sp. BS20 TaxID=1850526 RepID=UPI0007F17F47|nr:low molecular weight protein-tyrosine-phosphatase [Arachidicoccus sp. BS20]ANI88769.1 protein-tyrosine-phosphatase [Arachidicoccus sp. BS20]
MKVLMVCLGNICRSPLAEGILQHKADEQNLGWEIDSAGTGSWHTGEAPHRLSQKIARNHGIDISHLRARQFRKEDMLNFDKVYVMDNENYNDVRRMSGNLFDENKVDLILNVLHPNRNEEVPDPWYVNTDAAFEEVFQMLDEAGEAIIKNNQSTIFDNQ